MSELMRVPLDDESAVLVEVDFDQPEIGPVSRAGDLVRSAATSFDAALTDVRKAAAIALANFRDMELRPDEVQIEFGVKLNAQAGAVIARTGVDGHLKVKLTWQRTQDADDGDGTEASEKPAES